MVTILKIYVKSMMHHGIKASNGNSGLGGAGQADWLVRCDLSAVCVRETHTAGQARFV